MGRRGECDASNHGGARGAVGEKFSRRDTTYASAPPISTGRCICHGQRSVCPDLCNYPSGAGCQRPHSNQRYLAKRWQIRSQANLCNHGELCFGALHTRQRGIRLPDHRPVACSCSTASSRNIHVQCRLGPWARMDGPFRCNAIVYGCRGSSAPRGRTHSANTIDGSAYCCPRDKLSLRGVEFPRFPGHFI